VVSARDIVTEAQSTDTFLEEMRRRHKGRLRKAIRALEDKMVNQLAHLDVTAGGRLEGVKINLKQTQKIHARMLTIFEEEYGQTVGRVVGEYGQIATHIKRSWRHLGESVHFTDIDRAMLTSLQRQSYGQFAQFGEMAQTRMADAMYSSVVAGASYAQLVKTVQGILRGHVDVRGRSMMAYADTHAFDAVMNFHNDVNIKKSEDLGIKNFMYVGDIITTTRPFCRRRAGELYTRRQIDAWNRLSWAGKSGPPFTHRGGYNCRHHWRGFKDDWLDEAEEVGEAIQKGKKPKAKKASPVKARKGPPASSREVLSNGSVSGTSTPEKGGVNTTEIKTLVYGRKELRGAFKPISGEAFRTPGGTTWEPYIKLKKCPQAYREVMASEIDGALGFKLVPETILRKLDGEIGSLQEWVENSVTGMSVTKPMKIAAKEIYKTSVLDYVTGNVDRHSGNWLVNLKTGRMNLIDNGLSFCTDKMGPRSRIPGWYKRMSPGISKDKLMDTINASFTKGQKAKLIKDLEGLDVDSICDRLHPLEMKALKNRIAYVVKRVEADSIGQLTYSKRLEP